MSAVVLPQWTLGPAVAAAGQPPKPGLVLKHHTYWPGFGPGRYDLLQLAGEFFFHSSRFRGSTLGCAVSGASLRKPWRASIRYSVDRATGRPSAFSNAGLSAGMTMTPPCSDPARTTSKIALSRPRSATARLRRSRLDFFGANSPAASRRRRLRSLQVALTDRPMACAVCSRLRPNSSGSRIACACRNSSAVLALATNARAHFRCSSPFAGLPISHLDYHRAIIMAYSIAN